MAQINTLKTILFVMILITFFFICNWTSTKILVRDIIYLTRPVWDRSKFKEWNIIAHYYTDGMNESQLCELHNWKKRTNGPKIIDAIIFSVELDLLEIRIQEMWPFVDYFIVLESDKTFTGREKPLILKENLSRFSWAKDKLVYESCKDLEVLEPGDSPFENENRMRFHMNSVIKKIAKNDDLIICSDVDEILSAQTIQLLKQCDGFTNNMHLQLRMYLYSFEFFYNNEDSWRAHVSIYGKDFQYRHGRISDNLLADSGWHCSFCFRYLTDFIFKMTSYSHNDRVMRQNLLNKEEIQRKICNGDDVYDMYPEVYSIKELFLKIGSIPKTKAMTNLPKYLIENPKKFPFLLTDGCIREDFNKSETRKSFL